MANTMGRREMLGTLGALPALALSAGPLAAASDAYTRERDRLRALDLKDPKVRAKQREMPTATIGDLTLGRLICGSNLISMNMHARDLDYVTALASHYNTEERVFMTLKMLEERGCNSIILKNHNFKRFRLSKYWDEWGGKMKWFADVITRNFEDYERLLVEHLELGAAGAYLWGGATDIWYHEKKQDQILKAYEIMKEYDIPAGIAAHRLEPIQFCVKEGLKPDFFMKTLHHDRYWSAHPRQNRAFMEMYSKWSSDHDEFHDNLWCSDHEATVAFMESVDVPWIAFKIMAAGAIPPKDGFNYAFQNGADFVCAGMFDFQVVEDVKHTQNAVEAAKNRKRPWIG